MKLFIQDLMDKKTWQNLLVVLLGISFYFLVANLDYLTAQIAGVAAILQPFFLGFAFAFLLNGPMMFFEKKVFFNLRGQQIKRFSSVFCTLIITVSLLTLMVQFLLPQLAESMLNLLTQIPHYLDNLSAYLQSIIPNFPALKFEANQIVNALSAFLPKIYNYSGHLLGSLINIVVGVVIAVYFLVNKETYIRQISNFARRHLQPHSYAQAHKVALYGNETFSSFFYGKLLDSLLVGVICFVGCLLLGMPYPLLIATIVGITNIVPFFGPFIGALPSILLILAVDPWKALVFAIFILVLQQFDGNILGPLILSDSVGLPAIWVLFAILLGGGLFGFVGMIMGIPVLAMIYKLSCDFQHRKDEVCDSLKSDGLTAKF